MELPDNVCRRLSVIIPKPIVGDLLVICARDVVELVGFTK